MGCNCGQKKTTVKYTWTSSDGREVLRGLTELQANAKRARLGGTVTPQG